MDEVPNKCYTKRNRGYPFMAISYGYERSMHSLFAYEERKNNMAVVPTTSGKLSTLTKECKDLLIKTYPSLSDESIILIPLYGSDFDSIIFVVLDEALPLDELEDSDIAELIEKKKIAGIGSLFSPAIWTLEPGAEALCEPEFKSSLWGVDNEEIQNSIKEYDPHRIFSKKE